MVVVVNVSKALVDTVAMDMVTVDVVMVERSGDGRIGTKMGKV